MCRVRRSYGVPHMLRETSESEHRYDNMQASLSSFMFGKMDICATKRRHTHMSDMQSRDRRVDCLIWRDFFRRDRSLIRTCFRH
jgi:hypothetical protein